VERHGEPFIAVRSTDCLGDPLSWEMPLPAEPS